MLTNPSGVDGSLTATSDLLFKHPAINLTVLFGPEHGIRGAIYAGEGVADTIDSITGLPVYSLYGNNRKPNAASLAMVDVIVVDIQDIGLRAYTYIYTMAKVMQAAAENNKQVVIFDRPNPIGGLLIEGNLVEQDFTSFVGLYPIPYLHGMTIGELAILFNREYNINCDLKVVPMQGWKRDMTWEDTGLAWVPTSPHLPHWFTIYYMGATGTLGELGVLSTGVGYTSPFELTGAPWINGEIFADALNKQHIPGVVFRPLYFKPYYLHYHNEICQGVQLHISEKKIFKPYITGLKIMETYLRLYPEHHLFGNISRNKMFDKVMGTDRIRLGLARGESAAQLQMAWQPELDIFLAVRKKYLLYH